MSECIEPGDTRGEGFARGDPSVVTQGSLYGARSARQRRLRRAARPLDGLAE